MNDDYRSEENMMDQIEESEAMDDGDRNEESMTDAKLSHDQIEESEIQAFVGNNWGYYHQKWHSNKTELNWAAGFFSFIWLIYRKMYKYALLTWLAISSVFILAEWFLPAVPPFFERMINIFVLVLFGMIGNNLYKRRFLAAKEESESLSQSERLDFLKRKGGTNIVAAILVLLLNIALVVLSIVFDVE